MFLKNLHRGQVIRSMGVKAMIDMIGVYDGYINEGLTFAPYLAVHYGLRLSRQRLVDNAHN